MCPLQVSWVLALGMVRTEDGKLRNHDVLLIRIDNLWGRAEGFYCIRLDIRRVLLQTLLSYQEPGAKDSTSSVIDFAQNWPVTCSDGRQCRSVLSPR